MYQCEKCKIEINNNGSFQRHIKSCKLLESEVSALKKEYINDKKSMHYIAEKYNISFSLIKKYLSDNIRTRIESSRNVNLNRKLSDETKKKISEGRKKYLKENPDKHPWKKSNKFVSIPCENFKKILSHNNIEFIEEFQCFDDYNYSIDVAMPKYKIGFEINGNQHYNIDGSLKEYYQNRHNYIVGKGWNLLQIHYTECFNDNNILNIIKNVIEGKKIYEFNYDAYLKNKLSNDKKIYKCLKCSNIKKNRYSKHCIKCHSEIRRKVDRPSIEILLNDIEQFGYRGTGKKYGVSDNAIKKWLK